MLKKTLRFDDDVLEEIKNLQFNEDGTQAVITNVLDRKMYVAVNKALEAMGGKWNKSAKAHIFDEDPRSQVEGLLEKGSIEIDRDGFFPTPDCVINRMFNLMPVNKEGLILEPSAGNGAIVRRLLEDGVKYDSIVAVEINEKRAKEIETRTNVETFCADFMLWVKEWKFDQIYMNPPFENGQDAQHIMNAFAYLKPGGELISVISPHSLFANDARSIRFRNFLEGKNVYIENLPEGSFKSSGTMISTKLIVIREE
jgi:16S rRNA G966 N2-methylase RsmD